jgi:hypothetical protein
MDRVDDITLALLEAEAMLGPETMDRLVGGSVGRRLAHAEARGQYATPADSYAGALGTLVTELCAAGIDPTADNIVAAALAWLARAHVAATVRGAEPAPNMPTPTSRVIRLRPNGRRLTARVEVSPGVTRVLPVHNPGEQYTGHVWRPDSGWTMHAETRARLWCLVDDPSASLDGIPPNVAAWVRRMRGRLMQLRPRPVSRTARKRQRRKSNAIARRYSSPS